MSNAYYAKAMADMVLEIGRAKAQGVYGRAAAMVPAVQNIPRTLGAWVQTRDNRKLAQEEAYDREQTRNLRDLQMSTATLDHGRTLADWNDENQIRALGPLVGNDPEAMAREVAAVNPAKAGPYRQQASTEQAEQRRLINRFTSTILSLPAEKRPEAYGRFKGALAISKMPPLPNDYDETFVRDLHTRTMNDDQFAESMKPKPTEELLPVDVNGVPIYTPRSQAAGRQQYRAPEKPAAPKAPVERMVDGKPRDVIFGDDGNWYFPGDLKKAISPDRVRPVPDKTTPTAEDPRYTRDRQEYADYVRVHEKRQEGQMLPQPIDPATGRPDRFAQPQPVPYQPPESFELWRVRVKGRGPDGRPVQASTPSGRPGYRFPGQARRAAIVQGRRDGSATAAGGTAPVGPAQSAASSAPASQMRPPAAAAPSTPTTQTATPTASDTRHNVAIGSVVMYQGKRYRVKAIGADGQADLEPLP